MSDEMDVERSLRRETRERAIRHHAGREQSDQQRDGN